MKLAVININYYEQGSLSIEKFLHEHKIHYIIPLKRTYLNTDGSSYEMIEQWHIIYHVEDSV